MSAPDKNRPTVGVGAIVFNNDAVLLVKRKNPPEAGKWAVPGGKVRFGESLEDAVKREIKEETGIDITIKDVAYVFDVIDRDSGNFHYIVIDYEAEYVSGELKASDDALETAWVDKKSFRQICADENIHPATKSLLIDKYNF